MPTLTLDKLNDVVKEFDLNSDNYSTFVETGTYVGDTVRSVQPYFEQVHTIEISKSLFEISLISPEASFFELIEY